MTGAGAAVAARRRPARSPGPLGLDDLHGTPSLRVDRVEGDVVTALRLFHGAQDWPILP